MRILLLVLALAGVAGAGEYNYVWDGEGEYASYHSREWSECRNGLPQPNGWSWGTELTNGVTETGTPWVRIGTFMAMGNVPELRYGVQIWQTTTNPPIDKCTGAIGWWTWRLDYAGDVTNYSYWLRPGNLSMDFPNDPSNTSSPTDAADAAVMFTYWGTPVADLTGDGLTDAADASRLFEEWSGDAAPKAVPEPAGLSWIAFLLLYKRHNVFRHLSPIRVGCGG